LSGDARRENRTNARRRNIEHERCTTISLWLTTKPGVPLIERGSMCTSGCALYARHQGPLEIRAAGPKAAIAFRRYP
jgi:hypothetical protein